MEQQLDDLSGVFELVWRHAAHDLYTPLINVSLMAQNVQSILPKLIEVYNQSKNLGLQNSSIDEETLSGLTIILKNIETEIKWSSWYLSTISTNLQSLTKEKYPLTLCSIKQCVEFVLKNYPAKNDSSIIQLISKNEITNFNFYGNETLMKQILFNLLDNAVYSISAAEKGKIYLSSSEDQHFYYLHFKDAGLGIPLEMMNELYKQFFSTKNKMGLGLYFCKKAMIYIKGDILCESQLGESTVFILKFPK